MANEIQINLGRTGKTIVANVRNQTSGFIWNLSGPSFEIYNAVNIANYGVQMNEQGTNGYYVGNFPPTIPAGVYAVAAREQLGASPAQSDPAVGAGDLNWNGTVVAPLSDTAVSGQVGQGFPMRLARGIAVSGFPFKLVSSADHVTNFTSGVVSGQISRDGGSFGALQSGTITEMGLGFYRCNFTSGDLLATTVALSFSAVGISGGSADQRDFTFILQRTSGQ